MTVVPLAQTNEISLPGMAPEEIARVAQPLEHAWTMPPAAYTSPEIFELEKEAILRRGWLPIGRVDQVPNPGDYIALTLLDQPIMIVHGKDGEVRVMSRVCLHRAAPIVEGTGNRRLFTCPYHAWTYKSDGQLAGAPLMDDAEGFDKKKCRLPQMRTEIWNGFILVNFDDDAEPFAPQVAGFARYFENFKLDDMVIVKTLEFDSHWNWKVLVENFMEAYHHIATHSTTFEPIYHARDSLVLDADGPYSILRMPTNKVVENEAGLPMIEGLTENQQTDIYASVLFPFFLIGLQRDAMAWYQVLPISHDRLTLKIHVGVPRTTAELPEADKMAEAVGEMLNVIHHEDIGANDLVWNGLTAPLTRQGRLSPLERSIWQLNQWWLAKMAEAGPGHG